jgi:SAM-dependent methyltransferase
MQPRSEDNGLVWQIGVWDRMAQSYQREVDRRFASVVEGVVRRAGLQAGEQVLDLGSGTGAVAILAASLVGAAGHVTGVDISREMLALARERAIALGLRNLTCCEGRAEAIPGDSACCDVLLASLSLMYVIDRAAAAREIARVLRPGGRFVAAAWSGPADCDIVWFQQTAGNFAPPPPVPGVGPGALADPGPLLTQLAEAGVQARVETEVLGFDFDDFESAWTILAGVTTAALAPERREEAKAAVRALMWPGGDGPRHFRNTTHFIVGSSLPRAHDAAPSRRKT